MHFRDVSISGVKSFIGDAELAFYRIIGNADASSEVDPGVNKIHTHSYYECHLITSGGWSFPLGGEDIPAQSGELLIIPPMAEHCPFDPLSENSEIVFALLVNRIGADDGIFRSVTASLDRISGKAIRVSKTLFDKLCSFHEVIDENSIRGEFYKKMLLHEIIYEFLDEINCFDNSSEAKRRPESDDNMLLRLEFLINTPECPLSVMAEQLGYSPRHVARIIRNVYKKSLSEIRSARLLSTAKRLLSTSMGMSIEEIAQISGYGSADTMRKAFIREEGITPSDFRKKAKNERIY